MARKQRGLYEKVPGSGVWWIRYADSTGRIRREKAGVKSAARTLYEKRKTEVLQDKKLPEKRKRMVSFEELVRDVLSYSKAHKRSYSDDVYRFGKIRNYFGDRPVDRITAQDIEQFLAVGFEQNAWAPATANRYRALLSLAFRLGERNGKASGNPARLQWYLSTQVISRAPTIHTAEMHSEEQQLCAQATRSSSVTLARVDVRHASAGRWAPSVRQTNRGRLVLVGPSKEAECNKRVYQLYTR